MGLVSMRSLRKSYGAIEMIKGIDLDIKDGEFIVFVGPSGCGKSTTLPMIAGPETVTGGNLLIDGERANDLRPSDRGAAMVFQTSALDPHMTVAEILRITKLLQRFPKEVAGVKKLMHAKLGAGQEAVHMGQTVGLVPDVAWALRFDAQGRRIP